MELPTSSESDSSDGDEEVLYGLAVLNLTPEVPPRAVTPVALRSPVMVGSVRGPTPPRMFNRNFARRYGPRSVVATTSPRQAGAKNDGSK